MKGGGVAAMLVVAILATIVIFVIADLAGGIGDFPNERWAAAIAMIALLVWIGPGAFARFQGAGGGSAFLKTVAIWLAIACAVALLFVYGQDTLASLGFNV